MDFVPDFSVEDDLEVLCSEDVVVCVDDVVVCVDDVVVCSDDGVVCSDQVVPRLSGTPTFIFLLARTFWPLTLEPNWLAQVEETKKVETSEAVNARESFIVLPFSRRPTKLCFSFVPQFEELIRSFSFLTRLSSLEWNWKTYGVGTPISVVRKCRMLHRRYDIYRTSNASKLEIFDL